MNLRWKEVTDRLVARPSFLGSSLALISGTTISQALVFALSPALSRLYGPAEFGALANYNAWVGILALVSNLRYEHAIIVAKGRIGVNRVVALAISLTMAVTILCLVVALVAFFSAPSTGYLRELRPVVLLIPIGILAAVTISLLSLVNTRRGRFRRIALLATAQVAFTAAFQILFGLWHLPHGLVAGGVAGSVVTAVIFLTQHLAVTVPRHVTREMTADQLRETAVLHANFPRYSLAADALNIVSQQFAPVVLTALFTPVAAGLFAFSTRVVRVPVFIVSSAVITILRKHASDHLREHGTLWPVFRATAGGLALLAIVPFAFLVIFASSIFPALFGDKWADAAGVVRVLAPGIYLEFIALPVTVIFLITGHQRYAFRIQVVNVVLLGIVFIIGRWVLDSFTATCYLLSSTMVAINLFTIALAGRVSAMTHRQAAHAG